MQLELKPDFLFEWDPVIFHNGRIYAVGEGQEDGCLVAYEKRLGLVKLDNISVYEKNYFDHAHEQINAFQKEFVEATIRKEYKANTAAQRALYENEVLSFIVREVLPALTRQEELKEIDSILGVKKSNGERADSKFLGSFISDVDTREDNSLIDMMILKVEQEYASKRKANIPSETIEQILRRSYSNVEYRNIKSQYVEDQILGILEGHTSKPVRRTAVEENTDDSIFGTFLNNRSAAIIGGRVYALNSVRDDARMSIYLGSQRYGFEFIKPLKDLCKDYFLELEKKFKIEGLRNACSQSSSLAQAQRERQALKELLRTNNYENAGVGFEKRHNAYYVYVETPEKYALKSHDGNYYVFDKARLGLALIKDGSRIYTDYPILMGNYHHPFIPGPGTDLKICLGSYDYEHTRRLPPLESVLTFLSDAKSVILTGYGRGSNPHKRLDINNFGRQVKDLDYIRKNNIPITNKSTFSGRWD